jgi:hypothetical protein
MGEEQRIADLTRKAAEDVAELAKRGGELASEEVIDAGKRAIWPTLVTAAGGLFAAVGLCGVLLSPALRDAGRMRRLGLGYLLAGAAGSLAGLLALTREASHALPRTRRAAKAAVETLQEHAPA